MLGPFLRDL